MSAEVPLATTPITEANPPGRWSPLVALLVSALLTGGFQLLFGDHNLNLRDEGYLWYGVLGVLEGEVPFRDFQAYDPGRYTWCAWGSHLFGSGILGVRASVAAFQAIGLTFGVLVARRLVSHDAWLVVPAVILSGWMFPRHKAFEPALAMAKAIASPNVFAAHPDPIVVLMRILSGTRSVSVR